MFYHLTVHAHYSTKPDNPSVSRVESCRTWNELVIDLYRQWRVMRDLFAPDTTHYAVLYIHKAGGADNLQMNCGELVDSFETWSMQDGHIIDIMLNGLIAREAEALRDAVAAGESG